MTDKRVVVIGAGFTGLSAAYELCRAGIPVTVIETEDAVGGLAGTFPVDGARLEKFYHHWFESDVAIRDLAAELGKEDQILYRETRTGMYYARRFHRLSSPLDLLRFDALSFANRIRLGLQTLRARRIRDWKSLEDSSVAEWVTREAGEEVYRVVWEPLLVAKFGKYATDVSAVWLWSKLQLRGGSRSRTGAERLAYYRGGFAALTDEIVRCLKASGCELLTGVEARRIEISKDRVQGVQTSQGFLSAAAVVATTALPIVADLLGERADATVVERLRRINYLANICVVLRMNRSLSDLYWLNVNDASFPFVGVIEHTNFEPASTYRGGHIVYLSRYCPPDDPVFLRADPEVLSYTYTHIRRMFPDFDESTVRAAHVWRARYAQPVVERSYSRLIPARNIGIAGLYIASMAQIYPQDRGTNYAVRDGRAVGREVASVLAR